MPLQGSAAVLEWLRTRGQQRIYIVVVNAESPTQGSLELRFSNVPYSDADGATYYPYLTGQLRVGQRFDEEEFKGGAQIDDVPMTINNAEGQFDYLFTEDWVWGGREVEIYIVNPLDLTQDNLVDYYQTYKGYTTGIEVNETTITFNTSPYGQDKDCDIFVHVIGTPEERKDPITAGKVFNVTCFLDTVTPANLKYRAGYTTTGMADIAPVYIRGVAQTQGSDYGSEAAMDAATDPTAGNYITSVLDGVFQIGSDPDGPVTADIEHGWVVVFFTASDIAQLVGGPFVPVGSRGCDVDFNSTSMTAFRTAVPTHVGFFADSATNVNDALDYIFGSVGAVFWHDGTGEVQAERFEEAGTTVGTIDTNYDALEEIQIKRITPVWRVEVFAKRNHTVLANVPDSIDPDRQEELATEWWRENAGYAADSTTLSNNPGARILTRYTGIATPGDAQTEATRLLNLFKPQRNLYQLRVWGRPGAFGMHESWELIHPRFAPNGIDTRVVAVSDDFLSNTTELTLWG